jgi:Tol biopolymer transport system component
MRTRTPLGVFRSGIAVGVCAIAIAGCAQAENRSSRPEGTIAVATSADFRTIVLISPATRQFRGIRAPDGLVDLKAELSQDGTKIAIAGLKGIWIFARSGASARRILDAGSTQFLPGELAWSPSDAEFAFTRGEALFSVGANGKNVKKLFGGRAYAPDWSPVGNQIVFVRNPASGTGGGVIQSIGTDGSNLRLITHGGHPDISPDGSKLAFARRDGIYVMPLMAGKPRLIIRNAEHPEWSPSGYYLAFTRNVNCGEAGCSGRVFIVRATGGTPRAIGPRIFEVGALSWSR